MELKYKDEHLSCEYYQQGNKAPIDILSLKEGEEIRRELTEAEIIFIQKGNGDISYQKIIDQPIQPNQIFLLPPASCLYAKIKEDSVILIFRLDSTVKLCNTYALENLYNESKRYPDDEVFFLKINDRIDRYLSLVADCINDGLRCSTYLNIKIKELLYYFRIYYTKEEMGRFFGPILTKDSLFASFIFKNYKKAKTVQQLSNLYGYSQSSFEKQFKKVFGTSAYQWMIDKKAKQIFHKLTCSDKSFMEIADEFEFSSSSQFCDFCKHFLGASPKEIRYKRLCRIQ